MQLPKWLSRNRLYNKSSLTDDSESDESWTILHDYERVEHLHQANVISSQFTDGRHELHKVFIDLDVEHFYVHSSTSGHAHLYLNVDVTRSELEGLMEHLAEVGIVGQGWAKQTRNRDANVLRLPGHYKDSNGIPSIPVKEEEHF